MLLSIKPLMAQEEPEEMPEPPPVKPFRIGLGLGGSFAGYKDEVESPINRYLNALTFILDGNIEKGNFFHTLNVNFFIGHPEMAAPHKKNSNERYTAVRVSLEYALDYRLWGTPAFPGYLGGAFRTLVYHSGTDGKENEDAPSSTGLGLLSLDIHAVQKWIINPQHTLTLSLAYPIFGYAVRPAYAGIDGLWSKYFYENPVKIIRLGKFTSFHNYWAVSGDVKYQYRFNKLLSPYAGLGFEIARINFSRPRIDALFRLYIGMAFVF